MKDSLFTVITKIKLPAIASKETKDCFSGPQYMHCGSDFDSWFPADQPETAACPVAMLAPRREATFSEWVQEILKLVTNVPTSLLCQLFSEKGHTVTLTQAEEIVDRAGYKYNNFFFTGNKERSISIILVNRVIPYNISLFEFGNHSYWSGRLFIPNFNTLRLKRR